MKYVVRINGDRYELEGHEEGGLHQIELVKGEGDPAVMKALKGKDHTVHLDPGQRALRTADVDTRRVSFGWIRHDNGYAITLHGKTFDIRFVDPRLEALKAMLPEAAQETGELKIDAPIPGLVKKLLVAEGDEVTADQPVLILDAMKLENEIPAPREGVVKKIAVKEGDAVERNDLLLIIE